MGCKQETEVLGRCQEKASALLLIGAFSGVVEGVSEPCEGL